jgi:hypothetical protein
MQAITNRKFLGGFACLVLAAAIAVGGAAPQQAAALPKVKQAKFKVTVEGWQKHDWSVNHESTGRCDPTDHSYGGEYAKFKSIAPVKLTAIRVGKEAPSFLIGKGLPYIDTTADVARNAVAAVSSIPEDCPHTGGSPDDGPPIPSDCGLKTVTRYPVMLEYSGLIKNSIALTGDPGAVGPLFYNCGSGAFPNLIDSAFGQPIVSELPPKELFDKKIGKLIVIGGDVEEFPMPETKARTEVHWEISLTRKRKKK